MKLLVKKAPFIKSWLLAERSTGSRSALTVLTGVKCIAEQNSVTLQATDLKTSIRCIAEGVEVQDPGEAVFPVKVVGELFKKAPTETFTIEVDGGKAKINCGEKNHYKFTTYPVSEFPKLPRSEESRPFFKITVSELKRLLEEGTFAGSPGEEFPQYLSSGLFQVKDGFVKVVSTDGRRLSLSQSALDESFEEKQVLLPLNALKELGRIVSSVEEDLDVEVKEDDSQVYFLVDNIEFAIRRIESRFPPYEKILSPEKSTWMEVDRNSMIEALERAEIVVRDFSKMVILNLSPGGNMTVKASAPEIGEAIEEVPAEIDGDPLKVAFNVRFLLDGMRALHGKVAHMTFNGPNGQMLLSKPGEESFLYVLMPITLPSEGENL
ncbi:DNA polymerase III, beta subunit [Thermovirga lienii DSM 17291]|uniref:Beta sliding clamp n=1 Tax=Thermovirga lienii (strain ATCC BAA-1197 / DSM 17291 / Cas60314) TaxID=580340 RepID=G7V548_THELD|nr:DNA polymerase III subunit beta [Thermovirga lienii]AER65748.1 DNA polymerase III, beta subunit [Thermovirga lienii DSM 17291]